MANINQICGLKPYVYRDGSPYNGAIEAFYHPAGTTVTNDVFIGDPVTTGGSAGTTGKFKGLQSITQLTAGDGTNATIDKMVLGVVVGFKPDFTNLNLNYLDGAQEGIVYVCTDLDVLYLVQADEALAATSIGLNADLVKTQAGDTTMGTSGWQVDASSAANTATLQVKLEGFPQVPDKKNNINETYNKVLVSINQSVRRTGVLGG